MEKKNKLILIGPLGTGKTTLKNIFFNNSNPLDLLINSLEPTRGINSSIYSFFNRKIAIFDLAGQELENWFSKEKEVFRHCAKILCVFDINNSSELIVNFLLRILKIKKEFELKDCTISVLIHKVDLTRNSYIDKKILGIKEFFEVYYRSAEPIEIYKTSIKQSHFLQTCEIIYEIINPFLLKEDIKSSETEYKDLQEELLILMNLKENMNYEKKDIIEMFSFNINDAEYHISRLEKLGFLKSSNEKNTFKLTNRAIFFKSYDPDYKTSKKLPDLNRLNLMHTFLNLIEITT